MHGNVLRIPHTDHFCLFVCAVRLHDLYQVPDGKFIFLMDHGDTVPAVFSGRFICRRRSGHAAAGRLNIFYDPQKYGVACIGIIRVDHGKRIRLSEIEARCKIPVCALFDLAHVPVHPGLILLLALEIIVYGAPVGPCDRRHIEGRLHASFDLEAVYPCPGKLRQVSDHTEVPGIEDIGASLIFFDREILARPGLFRHGILPSAGVGAGAAIGVPSCKPGR